MPAQRFTKKANTPKRRRQWEHVYDSALSRGADKSSAIAQASGAVKKSYRSRRGHQFTGAYNRRRIRRVGGR